MGGGGEERRRRRSREGRRGGGREVWDRRSTNERAALRARERGSGGLGVKDERRQAGRKAEGQAQALAPALALAQAQAPRHRTTRYSVEKRASNLANVSTLERAWLSDSTRFDSFAASPRNAEIFAPQSGRREGTRRNPLRRVFRFQFSVFSFRFRFHRPLPPSHRLSNT